MRKLSIFALATLGALVLSGCNGGGETVNYTITEADYLLLKSNLNNPALFLNANFTISNYKEIKIANGKVEVKDDGNPFRIYNFKADTFNPETLDIDVDVYDWEEDHWAHFLDNGNLNDVYGMLELYYFTGLLDYFSGYTYDEDTHRYNGKNVEMNFSISLGFENGKLVYYSGTGEIQIAFEFSDYGTTSVELPTKYSEYR